MAVNYDQLLAESQIRRVLYAYCHAIDRRDEAELATVYHPDAVDNHGVFNGPASEYVPWVIDALQHSIASQHLIGNLSIDFAGDTAYVESYVNATMVLPDDAAESGEQIHFLSGRYIDRFELRDGAWKIAFRTFVRDFDYTMPTTPANIGEGTYVRGVRSTDDLSYQRLHVTM